MATTQNKRRKLKPMKKSKKKVTRKTKGGFKLPFLKKNKQVSRRRAFTFAIAFGILGVITLALSRASDVVLATVEAETMTLSAGNSSDGTAVTFTGNSTISGQFTILSNASKVVIRAKGDQCNGSPQMVVNIDGNPVQPVSVSNTSWADYTVTTAVASGTHKITIGFTNDYDQYKGNSTNLKCSRNLYVDKAILYTTDTPPPPPSTETAPATPTGLTATGITTSDAKPAVQLKWNVSAGTTLYNIYRTDQSFAGPWGWTTETTWTNASSTVAGTQYCYQIEAKNNVGVSPKTAPVCAAAGGQVTSTPDPNQPTVSCTKTLSAGGNVQSFVDSLSAGETGCLRGGTYTTGLFYFRRANTTVTSYPGERATIDQGSSMSVVDDVADNMVIKRINFVTSNVHTIRVYGSDVTMEDNSFTNKKAFGSGACVSVGGSTVTTYNLKLYRNIFHDCGSSSDNQNHPIYAGHARTITIVDNLFYGTGGYAVHLYPDVSGAYVAHNITDGAGACRGGNVIDSAFNDHVFERNIIINAQTCPNPNYATPSHGLLVKTGTTNKANYNCFYNNAGGDISGSVSQVGNINTNPLFVNTSTRDYRLQSGSGCLSLVQYDTYAKILQNR
jgi:hypothetical protein